MCLRDGGSDLLYDNDDDNNSVHIFICLLVVEQKHLQLDNNTRTNDVKD